MAKKLSLSENPDLIKIDLYNLHEEWLKQPELVYNSAMALAALRNELAEEKASMEKYEADLAKQVRTNPQDFNLVKVTESAVAEIISAAASVQTMRETIRDLDHQIAVSTAEMTALDHKKRALEGLVALHGQNYFAVPTIPQEDREAKQEATKKKARKPL